MDLCSCSTNGRQTLRGISCNYPCEFAISSITPKFLHKVKIAFIFLIFDTEISSTANLPFVLWIMGSFDLI